MRAYVKKLQNKSEESRKQILFFTMVISMSLVAGVFIYGLGSQFREIAKKEEAQNKTTGPFRLMADSISKSYKNMTASAFNSMPNKQDRELLNSVVPEIPEGKQIELIVIDKQQ